MKIASPFLGLAAIALASVLHAQAPATTAAPAAAAEMKDDLAAFSTTASGLKYLVTTHGSGPRPKPGQVVVVHYTGTLPDGKVFDSSRPQNKPYAFTLGRKQVIKGWDEAFALLQVGDKAILIIPPALAYGDRQRGPIPPNSTLRFDVELLELRGRGLSDLLQDTIDTAGLDAARARFAAAKAAKFEGLHVSESQLNGLGYHYLGKAGKLAEARAILQWNVELFPESANVYDSLGEADVKAGDRAAALAHYARSLELDPKNKNAARFLDELKATPDQPGALAQMQARMELNDAIDAAFESAEKRGYDVPALQAKLTAFLDRYPDDPGVARPLNNFFYYAESAGLEHGKAAWAAFADHPNAKAREAAAQKMALAELIKSPLALKFTAADGREVDVARLRGKVVLVDFWATWCGPCIEEIPNVVATYEQYHARGFEIVGISFDQAPDPANPARRQRTAEQVLAFTREHRMPWPQFYDGSYWENPFGKQYGVRGIPAMFLLDQRGVVVSTNARGKKLEEEVKRLLGL